ncbi:hypothetical protein FRC11_006046, partial [Ceratobasidium sp. 423]
VLNNDVCERMVLIDTELLAHLNTSSTHTSSDHEGIGGSEIGMHTLGDDGGTQSLALHAHYVEIDSDPEEP